MNAKPDKAYIKLHSWQRALAQLKSALGIHIQDGEKQLLPDGSTAFRFNSGTTRRPFQVDTSKRMQAGLFFYGGRVFFFPEQQLNTGGKATWTVGIRFSVEFVGDGTPDTLYLDTSMFAVTSKVPRLTVETLGFIGTNARLRLVAGNYEVTNGEAFWPIASYDGSHLIQHVTDSISGHIEMVIQANGDTRGMAYSYPRNG